MNPQTHRADPRILGRRTLQRDHRVLAGLLRPGLSVLDAGCGSGAITAGIAKAVGPGGHVVGFDRDASLLEIARKEHGAIPNLEFQNGDATSLNFDARFDIVTAARTLQWISEPGVAVWRMKQAAKRSGMLVVLDYNHAGNAWQPDPPAAFRKFYDAFLAWRDANHWDNRMADHLPELFHSAGLVQVERHNQDEVTGRGDALWSDVIETLGHRLVDAGFLTESQLRTAEDAYKPWVQTDLVRQTLAMRTVTGRVA